MKTCEDCGMKLQNGFCPNCQEAVFIVEQYKELDMPLPPADGKLFREYDEQLRRKPK